MLEDAIAQTEELLGRLKELRDELDERGDKTPDETEQPKDSSASAATTLEVADETTGGVRDAQDAKNAEQDNEQPYKCPGCGKTYSEPGTCANGHPPERLVATADVLAGAEATGSVIPPTEDAAAGSDDSSSSSSTTDEHSGSSETGTGSTGAAEGPTWPQ